MSGSGGGSGYNYQADAFAFIASYALAGRPINWRGRADDVPIAVATETRLAGDDFRVEIRNTSALEVQAKYHARLDADFLSSLIRLIHGLAVDSSIHGIILVDSTSANSITRDLRRDIERLAQGRSDGISDSGTRVLGELSRSELSVDAAILSRLTIVILDLHHGSMGEEAGLSALQSVLTNPYQARDAWQRLGKRGLEETAQNGRSEIGSLVSFLEPTIPVLREGGSAAAALLHYRSWLRKKAANFPIIGFRSLRLPSEQAWDHMLERPDECPAVRNLAEELRHYHEQDDDSRTKLHDELRTDDLVLMGEDCIVVGAAGAGKSTLVRRVICAALDEGVVPLHVRLKSFASRLQDGAMVEEALFDVALQGSGISPSFGQSLAPTLLLADGLDECGQLRSEIASHIRSWRRGHAHARVIVTTRSFGHDPADFPDFLNAELEPLPQAAIRSISQEIFAAYFGDASIAATQSVAFEVALQKNQAASIAARTPLLLGCLTALFVQGKPLPARRAVLFHDILEVLRNQQVDRMSQVKVTDTLADRVMEIAGWILINEPTLSKTKLREAIGKRLLHDGLASSTFASSVMAESALEFWEDRRLLERLTIGAHEIMTFVHLNLAEYAAARFAAGLDAADREKWIRRIHREPRWRQSILLATGIESSDAMIRSLLLEEKTGEEESTAAILAADALAEVEPVPVELAEIIAKALMARVTSLSAVNEVIKAAERLVAVTARAPGVATRVIDPFRDHPSALVRLVVEAVLFADEGSVIQSYLPEAWLNSFLPIARFRLGKRPLPPHNEDLPVGAADFHNRTVGLAVEALFRVQSEERALAVVTRFLTPRHGLDVLHHVEVAMARRGHHARFQELTPYIYESLARLFVFNTDRHRASILGLLDATAAVVGQPDSTAPTVESWRLISRLLAALEFWHLDNNDDLAEANEDRRLLEFAIDRTLVGLKMNREELRQELHSAYEVARNLTQRGIYPHVRQVRVKVDWRRAASPIDPDRVRAALLHKSAIVSWVGANLLENGGAGNRTHEILRDAILGGRRLVLYWLTQISPQITDLQTSAQLLAERLVKTTDKSSLGILEALRDRTTVLNDRRNMLLLKAINDLASSHDQDIARVATEVLQHWNKS